MDKKLILGCSVIAGMIIIPSVTFNKPIIALIGVAFDFLPLIFGWIKKSFSYESFIVIIVTYIFFIIWLFGPRLAFARILFAELWFITIIMRLDAVS